MRILPILSFVSCLMACSIADEFSKSSGIKLLSIAYTTEDDNWVENYAYSPDSRLNTMEDLRLSGRRYELTYEGDKIKEVATYSMDVNELIFRDSIVYNPNGTIQTVYNFSINAGQDLPLTWIYEFDYDSGNKVLQKSSYLVPAKEYTSIEKYNWNKNTIGRIEHYNGKGELHYEYFYTYDKKVNYKKGLPLSITDPVSWSENNVTAMNWKDYYGNLDLICRPCVATYKYNLDNYPVEIKYNWGRKLKLMYE